MDMDNRVVMVEVEGDVEVDEGVEEIDGDGGKELLIDASPCALPGSG